MHDGMVLRLSRRSLLGAAAFAAFALSSASFVAKAADDADSQAEWPQSYETSPQLAVKRASTPILSPETVTATEAAIQKYQDIVAKGGWSAVPGGSTLQIGSKGKAVEALRARLVASGDLDPIAGQGQVYDFFVEAGVDRFQARNGLNRTGAADKDTLAALNVPAATRLQQLQTNLVRLQSYSGDLGPRYVIVNLPGASVETVEGGVVYSHHRAGVGRMDRQSPIMQTRATEINFNPFWHVPPSLIKKDLIPKMKANPDYLAEEKIHILDKDGQEVSPSAINHLIRIIASINSMTEYFRRRKISAQYQKVFCEYFRDGKTDMDNFYFLRISPINRETKYPVIRMSYIPLLLHCIVNYLRNISRTIGWNLNLK